MKPIKLYVDDIRKIPDKTWEIARTVNDAIRIIAQWEIKEISLDHDIHHAVTLPGLEGPFNKGSVPCEECFCAVAFFIGEKRSKFPNHHPKITLHTANPVGAEKMKNILKDYGLECEVKMVGFD